MGTCAGRALELRGDLPRHPPAPQPGAGAPEGGDPIEDLDRAQARRRSPRRSPPGEGRTIERPRASPPASPRRRAGSRARARRRGRGRRRRRRRRQQVAVERGPRPPPIPATAPAAPRVMSMSAVWAAEEARPCRPRRTRRRRRVVVAASGEHRGPAERARRRGSRSSGRGPGRGSIGEPLPGDAAEHERRSRGPRTAGATARAPTTSPPPPMPRTSALPRPPDRAIRSAQAGGTRARPRRRYRGSRRRRGRTPRPPSPGFPRRGGRGRSRPTSGSRGTRRGRGR